MSSRPHLRRDRVRRADGNVKPALRRRRCRATAAGDVHAVAAAAGAAMARHRGRREVEVARESKIDQLELGAGRLVREDPVLELESRGVDARYISLNHITLHIT